MTIRLMPTACTLQLVGLLVAGLFGFTSPVTAQTPISAGNLVVLQVADRTANTAQAVSLIEYNPSSFASAVQTINVSSSGTTSATIVGNSTAGGILSYNSGNNSITFAAYRANSGASNPGSATSASVNRVIGALDVGSGTVNTNIQLNASYSALTFRSVATADGQYYYTSGANGTGGGPQLANLGSVGPPASVTTLTTTGLTTTTSNNTRQILTAGGNVFLASGSATPGQQVFQVGSGLPTTGSQSLTASFGNQGTTNQYNSFAFARLGSATTWNSTGFDTIYAVDNDNAAGSTVQKWSFDGSAWAAAGNISLNAANNIAVRQNSATSVDLYVTTSSASGSSLSLFTDSSGFGGSITGGSFTSLVSSVGNEGFYGVAFVPVPEPATTVALASAGLGLFGLVRRKFHRTAPALA